MSLAACCREICSEQEGRAIRKEEKEKKIQTWTLNGGFT